MAILTMRSRLVGICLLSLVVAVSLYAADLWEATAYCKGTTTASGRPVRRGMAASDPRHIPLGSLIHVSDTGQARWNGLYVVEDTGPEIKGREIDLYFWSCYEALDFGRRQVRVEVVRVGREHALRAE